MTFISMQMLWMLLAIPALAAGYALFVRRRNARLRRLNLTFLMQAHAGAKYRHHIPPVLLLLSLTLLILAMARPSAVVTLASQRGTLIMALDVSGSMRASDVAPTRIAAAQIAAESFVKERPPQVRIGIVAFSGSAFLVQVPTTDTSALDAAIESLQPQHSTAIGGAIFTSLHTIFPQVNLEDQVPGFGGDQFTSGDSLGQELNAPRSAKTALKAVPPGSYRSAAIILMTDGKNTAGPDPIEAARLAADLGVRVFTIGFGTANGQILGFYGRSVRTVLDEATLKQIADITRAQYFHAQTAEELAKIYKNLNTQLQKESQQTEISSFFVAAAAFFAGLSALLSMWWFGRIL